MRRCEAGVRSRLVESSSDFFPSSHGRDRKASSGALTAREGRRIMPSLEGGRFGPVSSGYGAVW